MFKKIRYFLLYFIYILAVTGLFLYLLFPSDTFKKYIMHQAAKKNPNLQVSVSGVAPAFPPGLKLTDVHLFYHNDSLIEAQVIKFHPLVRTFFGNKKMISFNGITYDGVIRGTAGIPKSDGTDKGLSIDADLSDIQIQNIKALDKIPSYRLSGLLGGKITYLDSDSNQTVTADLKISDGNIDLASPFFDLKAVAFKTVDANLTLVNRTNFQINECLFKGNDMDGSISGSVQIGNPLASSILNLSGTFKPHPPFIVKLGSGFSLFIKKKPGDAGIGFRIGGSIERPDFSIK